MKKIFLICFIIALFVRSDAMNLRYNIGLYNSAVETICSRLAGNYAIGKEAIKQELRFIDTRKTSPVLNEEYGQVEKFNRLISRASLYERLKPFVEDCKNVFDNGDLKSRAAVHFLLTGVCDHCEKNMEYYKVDFDEKTHCFDKDLLFSFLKTFHLDKVDM